jgi:fructokinase
MAGLDTQPPLVVGLGEVLWDLLPAGKQLGGAPANFAYHAQQLGARSAVVSAVGRDALGQELLDRLREVGLDVAHVAIDSQHPTGTVSVTLDRDGVPSYVIHENVAWDFLALSPRLEALARRADVVCFGSIAQRSAVSRQAIGTFLAWTRGDCLRVFDINLRQKFYARDVITRSLELANVLKLNDQELPIVADLLAAPREEGDFATRMRERFELRIIALTRGGNGSTLYAPGSQPAQHAGFKVTVADTVGAGDAFTAALAMGLLRGDPLDRINESANRLASYVCTQAGAMPPVPASLAAG